MSEEKISGKLVYDVMVGFHENIKKVGDAILFSDNINEKDKAVIIDFLSNLKFLIDLLMSDLVKRSNFYL